MQPTYSDSHERIAMRTQRTLPIFQKRFLKRLVGYGFVLPSLAIYVVFLIYPFVQMIRLSFFEFKALTTAKTFVGLGNYQAVLENERFWDALRHNAYWTVGTFLIPLAFGFLIAEVLARGRVRGRNFFRTVLFIPVTISPVVVGTVFIWIYQPRWGVLNSTLRSLGLDDFTQLWLGSPDWALPAVIVAGVWGQIGFFMATFLAGLQKIPQDLYDAAKVDGANYLQEMFFITIPSMRYEITFMSLISVIWSFKVFDIVRVMTRGGPFNSSDVLGHLVFKTAFVEFKFGEGTAMAVLLTLIIFIINAVMLSYRERVQY